jgi:hypothetical protein
MKQLQICVVNVMAMPGLKKSWEDDVESSSWVPKSVIKCESGQKMLKETALL